MHDYNKLRQRMVQELQQKGIREKRILHALGRIPREHFVLEQYRDNAYEDIALPSVANQTISQPYTVAFMLELLEVKPKMKILEIGTGSGYNAALLSLLVYPGKVFTCEINKQVYEFGRKNLEPYKNIYVFLRDGSKGMDDLAPFDRIIITAAASEIPPKLIEQLRDPGILIAPVGSSQHQNMIRLGKYKKKTYIEEFGDFMFVPLKTKED